MLEKHEESTSASTADAASFVNEHVDAIRTVVALGRERETMRIFKARIQTDVRRKRFFFLGTVGFALSYGTVMCVAGLMFYRGSQRRVEGLVSSEGMTAIRSSTALTLSFLEGCCQALCGSRSSYDRSICIEPDLRLCRRLRSGYPFLQADTSERLVTGQHIIAVTDIML
jgi:hypothetical protein